MVFRHFFSPYLFHRSRNNRRDKLRSKFWLEKNVQKTTFEAAEMMLGPWNQQNCAWLALRRVTFSQLLKIIHSIHAEEVEKSKKLRRKIISWHLFSLLKETMKAILKTKVFERWFDLKKGENARFETDMKTK